LRFEEIHPGQVVELDGRRIEAIAVNHVVPCIGYRIEADGKAFAFSGDTTTTDHFWEVLNGYDQLDLLVAECAFPNRELELSRMAYHYCPQLLAADLAKLRHRPQLYLSHLKPGMEAGDPQRMRGNDRGLPPAPAVRRVSLPAIIGLSGRLCARH
jgi:ribonuclease BN (tRNA processing enzyme)